MRAGGSIITNIQITLELFKALDTFNGDINTLINGIRTRKCNNQEQFGFFTDNIINMNYLSLSFFCDSLVGLNCSKDVVSLQLWRLNDRCNLQQHADSTETPVSTAV